MKSFMLISASTALATATAGVTYDPATNTYTCDKANVAYCAGDSLGTDIIIRCDANKKGQPGRCPDNLAGEPPVGVKPALCWQSSPTAGDAACEKNCVVYSGYPFTLPPDVCTPDYPPTSTSSTSPTYSPTSYPVTSYPVTSYPVTSYPVTSYPPSSTSTYCPPTTTEYPTTSTSTYCPPTTYPPTTLSTSTYCPPDNTTITYTHPTGTYKPTYPLTYPPGSTPSAPTYSAPVATAGAAIHKAAGGALAAVGLVAAYLL